MPPLWRGYRWISNISLRLRYLDSSVRDVRHLHCDLQDHYLAGMSEFFISKFHNNCLQLKNDEAHRTPPSSTSSDKNSKSLPRTLLRKEIKATVNISLFVLIFIISWFPLHIVNILSAICKTCEIDHNIIPFTMTLAHSNSAVNSILYAYHLKGVRITIIRMFRCSK